MVSNDRNRGQVILIGAITLAFILLGIVVVFNGVLYTETLSSGGTSQGASNADVVEYEVNQSVGCLLEWVEDGSTAEDGSLETLAEENISALNTAYRETTVQSTPVAVTISDVDAAADGGNLENATVTIEYDSNSLNYSQERTIEAHCAGDGP
ncbi:hypothetical protein [Natrinema salaciae]|uniref:Uncharacterized protein n=1 Tax=Natrinema salaciae TaxID=1186196 RepID=A0A1H9FYB6_9EURY|nr:hypothetical protein [Natrinema salaciae]SEQ42857.1 hypothetical protein SAMN04489841_1715 [Natrinema salaciae]